MNYFQNNQLKSGPCTQQNLHKLNRNNRTANTSYSYNNVAETTQAAATPETEQTTIGQQLLQAANNRIQEQQNQLAEQQRLRQEAEKERKDRRV